MAQRDYFEHRLAAASGLAETDRGLFSAWRRDTAQPIARGSKSPINSRGPDFEEAQAFVLSAHALKVWRREEIDHNNRFSSAVHVPGGFPVLERSAISLAIWAAICVTFVSRSSPSSTNRAAPTYGSNESAAPGFLLL